MTCDFFLRKIRLLKCDGVHVSIYDLLSNSVAPLNRHFCCWRWCRWVVRSRDAAWRSATQVHRVNTKDATRSNWLSPVDANRSNQQWGKFVNYAVRRIESRSHTKKNSIELGVQKCDRRYRSIRCVVIIMDDEHENHSLSHPPMCRPR